VRRAQGAEERGEGSTAGARAEAQEGGPSLPTFCHVELQRKKECESSLSRLLNMVRARRAGSEERQLRHMLPGPSSHAGVPESKESTHPRKTPRCNAAHWASVVSLLGAKRASTRCRRVTVPDDHCCRRPAPRARRGRHRLPRRSHQVCRMHLALLPIGPLI